MDPIKLAADIYTASSFDNLKAATAAQVTTDAGADLAAVQVFNFTPGQDKIDLADIVVPGFEDGKPGLGLTAASGKIYIATAQQDATAGTLGSVKAAAEFVAANDASAAARTIDVFEYKGSTYIFDDASGNNVMHTGPGTTDGLIKLVGTLGVHLTDFV
jgi:hypothetical protein